MPLPDSGHGDAGKKQRRIDVGAFRLEGAGNGRRAVLQRRRAVIGESIAGDGAVDFQLAAGGERAGEVGVER